MTKKNIILTFCLLIVFGILILVYGVMRGWFNKKSKASGTPTVSLRLDPVSSQIDENGPFSYTIKAKSNQNLNIIGYLFTIDFDKTKIQVNTIEYKTGVISQDLGQDTNNKDVINQLGKIKIQAEIPSSQGQLITSNTDIDLIVVGGKALATGIPQLSLSNFKLYQINSDATLTEVSGGVGEFSTSSSSSQSSSSGSVASSSSSNQSASSSSAQESVKVELKIKYRMQGVLNWIASQSAPTKFAILKNGTAITSTPNSFTASLSSDLLWHGQIEQQLLSGNDYALLIKPDKHLQRKVCSLSARDSTTLYSCGQDKIILSSTTTDLDLSGLIFFTGDITGEQGTSDGKVDSLDYVMIQLIIKNNTGKDPAQVAKADLNYDGIVDTQDASLIIEVWQKGINQDEK
ncbi:hypothetical protein GW881_01370 [Candidatus Roizmanbacteria bacterium]|nr:hypothetical protein [Candidatus Roizmanbacteria bacterium]